MDDSRIRQAARQWSDAGLDDAGGGMNMKRTLLLIIIAGTALGAMLPGALLPHAGRRSWLPVLAAVLENEGARVTAYDLQGWAILKETAEPARAVGLLQERLGLAPRSPEVVSTDWGQAWRVSGALTGGAELQVLVQNDGSQPAPRNYCLVSYRLPAVEAVRGPGEWELRLRSALEEVAREHGLYLTVQGLLPRQLGLATQQSLGRSLFLSLGGRATGLQQTERYLSLTGYSPLLADLAAATETGAWQPVQSLHPGPAPSGYGSERPAPAGRAGNNINAAFVGLKDADETRIYLGTPVITTEY